MSYRMEITLPHDAVTAEELGDMLGWIAQCLRENWSDHTVGPDGGQSWFTDSNRSEDREEDFVWVLESDMPYPEDESHSPS